MSDSFDLGNAINTLAKEKGIPRSQIISALESALLSAAKKHFGQHLNLEVHFNPEIGDFEIIRFRTVVETVYDNSIQISLQEAREKYDPTAEIGDEIGEKLDKKALGRIAAQTAKQVISQKVLDAQRDAILEDFKDERGKIVSGFVQRIEKNGDIIVTIGRAEGLLPKREQIPREKFNPGDRIKGLLLNIDRTSKEGYLIISRSHPQFVARLFEAECPELKEGLVKIVKIARKAGEKTKILVSSTDPSIDPEGCLIGVKRSRVNMVSQELNGERIDIIGFSDDQPTLVAKALRPAKPVKILVDEDNRAMEVVVPDSYLAVAIGNRGVNVTLASQLTGWNVSLLPASVAEETARQARKQLERIPSITFPEAEFLYQAGFRSIEDVANATSQELEEAGIDPERVEELLENAKLALSASNTELEKESKIITDLNKLDLPRDIIQTLISFGLSKIHDLAVASKEVLATALQSEDKVNLVETAVRNFLRQGSRLP